MEKKSTKNFDKKRFEAIVKEIERNSRLTMDNREEIWINPPPCDNRCECCGKHISEVKPFGGPGDPLRGDFSGALLVKNFRTLYDYQADVSWECRDCIVLSLEEFNKRHKEYYDKQKNI
jgi:hypothetical protein